MALGRKKAKKDAEPSEDDPLNKKKSNHVQRKLDDRKKDNKAKIVSQIEEQFLTGKLYGEAYWISPTHLISFPPTKRVHIGLHLEKS